MSRSRSARDLPSNPNPSLSLTLSLTRCLCLPPGALPAVALLGVAALWMPESPAWLRARTNLTTASGARKPLGGGRPCDARGLVLATTLGLANQATGSYAYVVYTDLLFRGAQAREM